MAGKLFQEFIVESWASTEQAHLDYITNDQANIRSDTYQGLADAVAAIAPCTVDEKCSKGFLKPFRDQTSVNEDSYANLRR